MRVVLLFTLTLAAPAAAQDLSPAEIAERARSAVVVIEALREGEVVGAGSGFIVSEDGRLVTNRHVIEGADQVQVQLASGEIYDNVFFIADDERRDLAILRIPATGLHTLALGDERDSAVGDPVYVMGNPLGLEGTFSNGLVSASRTVDGVSLIQITAPISPGSSGGPVLNGAGVAIGVASLTLREGQNLNMAVPARYASGLLAIDEEPQPFARVAHRFAPPDSADRSSPGDRTVEDGSDDLELWQRVLFEEMAAVADIAEEGGLVQSRKPYLDLLESQGSTTVEWDFDLARGEVLIVGVCDVDCSDLDLAVYDGAGTLLDSDYETDDRPVVTITNAGTFTIEVVMADCRTETCGFAVQSFAAPR